MTVAELVEELKRLPQDAPITILEYGDPIILREKPEYGIWGGIESVLIA